MFTHTDIWTAIDRLAANNSYSASGLAKKAGLDPTTFNKSKRVSADGKPRWPSTESLSKILAVTNTNMADFLKIISDDANTLDTLPVVTINEAMQEGYFDERGQPIGKDWDATTKLHGHDGPAFGIEIASDDYAPYYFNGQILAAATNKDIRKDDKIIIKTRDGKIHIGQARRVSATRIEFKNLSVNGKDENLPLEKIYWTARILWVSQ